MRSKARTGQSSVRVLEDVKLRQKELQCVNSIHKLIHFDLVASFKKITRKPWWMKGMKLHMTGTITGTMGVFEYRGDGIIQKITRILGDLT